MTNAQKWVFAFLILFIILFLLSRAVQNDDPVIDEDVNYYANETNELKESKNDALTLINKFECTKCHGGDLKGTDLAPGLYDAKEYWTRSNLINYFRNPSSYSGDERFDNYLEQYKSIMPDFGNKDVKELGIIADYILSLKK
jgi:hypothetical protein